VVGRRTAAAIVPVTSALTPIKARLEVSPISAYAPRVHPKVPCEQTRRVSKNIFKVEIDTAEAFRFGKFG
jgi:mRNA-degrading endonuclease toxin of MazEF toxin-antitoxin module